jgi:hypothetical protein
MARCCVLSHSSNTMHRTEFSRGHASGIRQAAPSPLTPLCAFERILLAMCRRTLSSSAPIERSCMPVRGRLPYWRARESWLSAIMVASSRRRSRQLGFRRSAALCKKYSPHIGCVSENAGLFHGFGSLGTRQHRARLFERRQRVGFQIGPGTRGFLFLNHGGPKLRQPIPVCLFGLRQWNRKPAARARSGSSEKILLKQRDTAITWFSS